MTNFRTLTAATAILSACTLLSGAAYAQASDMTCADYNALDGAGQRSAARAHMDQLTNAGPEAKREEVQPDAVMSTDTNVEQMETGKDGRDDRARGDNEDGMMSAMKEHCSGGDDLLIKDTPSRAEQGASVE